MPDFTPIPDRDLDLFNKITAAQDNPDDTELHTYVCETCGATERLTEKRAFKSGWDYPPFMGAWGIVSPRTCGQCPIDTTAYWAIISGQQFDDMPQRHRDTIERIMKEVEDHARP